MFCQQCGKEIQEDWKRCPYCSEEIHNTESEVSESGKNIQEAEPSNTKTDFTIGNTGITGRFMLKALAIIAMVCFFCSLYMVSCAGQEITSLNGLDMTFGFQYMDENIEGNLIFGLLFILPLMSFCSAFVSKKTLASGKRSNKLKEKSYSCATCSCSMVLLARYFTSTLEASASESGIGIVPCAALNIMCVVGVLSMVVGGYLAFLAEPRMKGEKRLNTKIIAAKSAGIIIGASLMFIIIISFPIGGELRPSTVSDDYTKSEESPDDEGEGDTDLSQIDMEELIGASKNDMEDLGFNDGVYKNTRVEYDENDAVNMILIEGTGESTPSFHGVTIGMQRDEAAEALGDVYTLQDATKENEGFIRLNVNTREAITCVCEDDKVKSIIYSIYSENEVEQFQSTMNKKTYIFPDSDKKYLSQDEVRSVETDKLILGRNEIFARHGRIFEDQNLVAYFTSQSWYQGTVQGDQFNADTVFNDFEKKNIELIKKVEDELNNVPINFIGDTGSYVTDTEFYNAPMSSGVICIDSIDRDANTVEMRIGYPDMPSVLAATGTITDDKTVTADCQMFKITMAWNGDGTVTVNQYDAIQGTYTDAVLVEYIKGTFHYIGRQGTQSY